MDKYIREVFKETFIIKEIYMGRPSSYLNQHLANLIIDEQFPIWDKNGLLNYKSIYLILKVWLFLEFRHFHLSQ